MQRGCSLDHMDGRFRSFVSKYLVRIVFCVFSAGVLSGCTIIPTNAYTNDRAPSPPEQIGCARFATDQPGGDPGNTSRATFSATAERGRKDTLVILALSGGGSRSANWAAHTMLELQRVFSPDLDLLAEVDVISSVSGGSLPAAYYAISIDDPKTEKGYGRVWDEKTVATIMQKDYIVRWFGNWFWPQNIARYWFTAYDRTDIMAKTFADNVFDTLPFGRDLKMKDLRCTRPYLILDASNATRGDADQLFTFTTDQFATINSDLANYDLARSVMASATFPAVFSDMTLFDFPRDEKDDTKKYVHVFDGGMSDNLGLEGAWRVLEKMKENGARYDKLIVISVDAYTNRNGVPDDVVDPRGSFADRIVDTNFLNATGSLLFQNRRGKLEEFVGHLNDLESDGTIAPGRAIFFHVQFADVPEKGLRREVNQIGTNFRIADKDAAALDRAAHSVITASNPCLVAIRGLILDGSNVPKIECPVATASQED
jgi:NTE family protein